MFGKDKRKLEDQLLEFLRRSFERIEKKSEEEKVRLKYMACESKMRSNLSSEHGFTNRMPIWEDIGGVLAGRTKERVASRWEERHTQV